VNTDPDIENSRKNTEIYKWYLLLLEALLNKAAFIEILRQIKNARMK
jgi:hypothetical protein